MAFRHGKNAIFKIDNTSAALQDISAYCDDLSLPRSIDTGETTTFGVSGGSKTYVVGLNDATIKVGGKWDSALDAIIAPTVGFDTPLNFNYGPEGSTTGRVKLTGTCILTSYEVSAPVGDVVTFSAEYQITGPVTRTTF